MRQKKSKKIFYILGLVFLLVVIFAVSRDLPIKVEHVEEQMENVFLKK
ncbi:MAG: hypothetical protein PHE89_01565 [Alphaproteobacteria bacterium]|nr:hypothetical protein [Alphaproteobacteria bacterium]